MEMPTLNFLAPPFEATAPVVPVVPAPAGVSPPDWQPAMTRAATPAATQNSVFDLFIFLPSPLDQHRDKDDDAPHQPLPVCVDAICRNHIRDQRQKQHSDDGSPNPP